MAQRLKAKQPYEAFWGPEFDLSETLGDGITISSYTVGATDMLTGESAPTILDDTKDVATTTSVTVWVQAGSDGTDYLVTFRAVDTAGNQYELDAILPVRAIPLSAEPVTLTEAKLHLRLAVTEAAAVAYTDEDSLLLRLIQAAREGVEWETGRALITQTRTLYLDEFPNTDYIKVPYPPLQSATMTYKDEDGAVTSFTDYDTDTRSEPGRLVLKPDCEWPTDTLYPTNPITITYICGYGTTGASVPARLKSALLLMVSDYYEHRGEVVVGAIPGRIQRAIDSLLDFYRMRAVC